MNRLDWFYNEYAAGFNHERRSLSYQELMKESKRFRIYEQECANLYRNLRRFYPGPSNHAFMSKLYYELTNCNDISYQYYRGWFTMQKQMRAYSGYGYRTSYAGIYEMRLVKKILIQSFYCGIFFLEPTLIRLGKNKFIPTKIDRNVYYGALENYDIVSSNVWSEGSIENNQKEKERKRLLFAIFLAYENGITDAFHHYFSATFGVAMAVGSTSGTRDQDEWSQIEDAFEETISPASDDNIVSSKLFSSWSSRRRTKV